MGRFTRWLAGLFADTDTVAPVIPKAPTRVRVWAEREMAAGTIQRLDLGAYPTERISFTLRDKVHPRTAADSAGRLTFLRLTVESDDGMIRWPVLNAWGREEVTLELDDVLTIDVPLTVRYS